MSYLVRQTKPSNIIHTNFISCDCLRCAVLRHWLGYSWFLFFFVVIFFLICSIFFFILLTNNYIHCNVHCIQFLSCAITKIYYKFAWNTYVFIVDCFFVPFLVPIFTFFCSSPYSCIGFSLRLYSVFVLSVILLFSAFLVFFLLYFSFFVWLNPENYLLRSFVRMCMCFCIIHTYTHIVYFILFLNLSIEK